MAGHSIEGLINWLRRDEWRAAFDDLMEEHLGQACDEIDGSIDDLSSLIGDEAFSVLWGCMFEDFLTLELDDGRNLVADYLKRRGFQETASIRAYMNSLRHSVMSLYEISDLRPGESFLARDLIRGGEPVRVSEKSGSRQLRSWDRIAARIMQVGPRTVMGGGALRFDHQAADALVDLVCVASGNPAGGAGNAAGGDDRTIIERAQLDDVLADLAPAFSAAWLGGLLENILHPAPLALSNSDGDDLLFTTIRYPLLPGVPVKAVRAGLNRSPELLDETANFWNWLGDPTPARKTQSPDGTRDLMIGAWAPDGSTVLGTIEIQRRSVVLDVNSAGRSARGQMLLGTLLNGLIGAPQITTQTLDELRENRSRDGIDQTPLDLPAEQQQEIVRQWMDQHYRSLLDEPVPMLGDRAPRELAREKGDRDQLVAWLKFMENGAAKAVTRSPADAYDLAWMWEELGVAELRC